MPDKELLDLAAKGKLNNEATLRAQMRRMLKDPKVSGFALEFFGQWLQYRDFLKSESVNRQVFPEFDEASETGDVRGADALCHLADPKRPLRARSVAQRCDLRQQAARQALWACRFTAIDTDWEKTTGLHQQGRGGFLGHGGLPDEKLAARSGPVPSSAASGWSTSCSASISPPRPPMSRSCRPRRPIPRARAFANSWRCTRRMRPVPAVINALTPSGCRWKDSMPIGKSRTKDLAGRPIDNLVHLPTGEARARHSRVLEISGCRAQAGVHPDAVPQVSRLRAGAIARAFGSGARWKRCRPSWKRTTIVS